MLANLTHFTNPTDASLVLGVVLGSVKRAFLVCCAAVDGCVACGAHLELGELIKLNLNSIVGIALALSLGPPGLENLLAPVMGHDIKEEIHLRSQQSCSIRHWQ